MGGQMVMVATPLPPNDLQNFSEGMNELILNAAHIQC